MRKLAGKSFGFTLMEVVLAIVILAGSLVVILGLQYSALQKTFRDRTKQRAMLLGRSILAAIEIDPETVVPVDRPVAAYKLAEELLGIKYVEGDVDELSKTIMANLQIEKQLIPSTTSAPIRLLRVTLRLFWSEEEYDSFEVVYHIPDYEDE